MYVRTPAEPGIEGAVVVVDAFYATIAHREDKISALGRVLGGGNCSNSRKYEDLTGNNAFTE